MCGGVCVLDTIICSRDLFTNGSTNACLRPADGWELTQVSENNLGFPEAVGLTR